MFSRAPSGASDVTVRPFAVAVPRNRLLAAASPEALAACEPHLTRVSLAVGTVLYGPARPVTHVYFPDTCVVSVITLLTDDPESDRWGHETGRDTAPAGWAGEPDGGLAVEVGTVGREGLVGLGVFLSGRETDLVPPGGGTADAPSARGAPGVRAVVQVAGDAWRMPVDAFLLLVEAPGPLHRLLHRYTQAYLAQVTQTAACNATHRLDARCARWLLATRDRVEDDRLPLTHAFLAAMLGVRETGVARALAALAARGLVVATRDAVAIVDRAGLERTTCACWAAVRAEYDRLLGAPADAGTAERSERA